MKVPEEKPLSIRLLGPPEVGFEGRRPRFGRKKVLALLCYLAADGGNRPRRELAELLWPQSDERRARTDLRSVLTSLRKTLGEAGARSDAHGDGVRTLALERDLLGLEPRGVELDLRALEAAVSLVRSETSEPSLGGGQVHYDVGHLDLIARLEGALEVYRGEFMEGFSLEGAPEFDLWLEAERVKWRGVFGKLCEGISRLQSEAVPSSCRHSVGGARGPRPHGGAGAAVRTDGSSDARRGGSAGAGGRGDGCAGAFEDGDASGRNRGASRGAGGGAGSRRESRFGRDQEGFDGERL
jgi:hypothetical protein